MTPTAAVYLDNAATTRLDPEVLEAMLPLMTDHFGNPSSIHSHGRMVRTAIEKARKTVASLLNTSPAEFSLRRVAPKRTIRPFGVVSKPTG